MRCSKCDFPLNPLDTKFVVTIVPRLIAVAIGGACLYWTYFLAKHSWGKREAEGFPYWFLFILFTYAGVFGLGVKYASKSSNLEKLREQAHFAQRRHFELNSPKQAIPEATKSKSLIIDYPDAKGLRKTKSFQSKLQAIQFIEAQKLNWWEWYLTDEMNPEPQRVAFSEFGGEADFEETESKNKRSEDTVG